MKLQELREECADGAAKLSKKVNLSINMVEYSEEEGEDEGKGGNEAA